MKGCPLDFSVHLIREGVVDLIEEFSSQDKLKKALNIEEKVDISDPAFDFEIYETKAMLNQAKAKCPDDYFLRDVYERRLLDLVEKQKSGSKKESKESKLTALISLSQAIVSSFKKEDFLSQMEGSSEDLQTQLSLKDKLSAIAQNIKQQAAVVQQTPTEFQKLRDILVDLRRLLADKSLQFTIHELTQSQLFSAIEILLTKTPRQARELLKIEATDSSLVDED